ncbi:MAG: hypothetical protein WD049_09140 [Candidatus Paceibacterota bacterium]
MRLALVTGYGVFFWESESETARIYVFDDASAGVELSELPLLSEAFLLTISLL